MGSKKSENVKNIKISVFLIHLISTVTGHGILWGEGGARSGVVGRGAGVATSNVCNNS